MVYFIDGLQISDIISEQLLIEVITNFDEYIDKENVINNIASDKSEIEKSHQHMLLALLQFSKAKRNSNTILKKYPKVEMKLK